MSEVRELRRSLLEDHARRREGFGAAVGASLASHLRSDTCGDEITIRVDVQDGRIAELGWDGIGCQICTASASMLAEFAPGLALTGVTGARQIVERILASDPEAVLAEQMPLFAARAADAADFESLAGIARYPLRARCALLPWKALEAAIADAVDA